MTRRHFLTLALLVVGIGYVQWLVVPAPVSSRIARPAEEPWQMPARTEFDARGALAALNGAGLWGKLADAAPEAPRSDPGWSFLGAMTRGQERYVIIKIGNQPEQRLAPGDTLPGGSKILSIENDRLCILINNQKRSLAIFPQGELSGTMPNLPETAAQAALAQPGKRRD